MCVAGVQGAAFFVDPYIVEPEESDVRLRPNPYSLNPFNPNKTVTARFWHIKHSHGQILVHGRQTRPDSGTYKTVTARFWPWLSGRALTTF
jgi:hypothetical protein